MNPDRIQSSLRKKMSCFVLWERILYRRNYSQRNNCISYSVRYCNKIHFIAMSQDLAEQIQFYEINSFRRNSKVLQPLGQLCTDPMVAQLCRTILSQLFGPFAPGSYYNVDQMTQILPKNWTKLIRIALFSHRNCYETIRPSIRVGVATCSTFILANSM